MSNQSESTKSAASLQAEVEDRFGVLPNFFRLAPDAPEITQNLWGFAKFGYLDNPLPSLFKERLFVYLSQFCNVRYCISRHVGFLVGLGRPSGDEDCPPQSVEQIVRMLRLPLPRGAGLEPYIQYCRAQESAIEDLPNPETFAEEALFACASHVFLQTEDASRCLQALSKMLDAVTHQQLLVFLTFVRTAHFWTKLHPELQHESDITELLGVHEVLAQCVLNEREEANSETTQVLLDELLELRKEREQAELLRVTLACIGDAVIATDPHGRVTTMNAVAEKLTGWTSQSAFRQPLTTVFHIVNETTRQEVENPALRALKEGIIVGLANHTILIAKDGSETPIDDSAAPIRSKDEEVLGSVLVFRDISERQRVQKSERQLASVVESSDDAIITKSLDGIIQSWNASAERIFGYPKNEAVGRHISILIPDERLDEEDHIISRLRAGERVEHFETVRKRSDGRSLDVSLTVSPIKDAEGKVIGASKIARDITEHKLAETALRESEERYRTLFESMDEGFCVIEMIFDEAGQPVDYLFHETNRMFAKQSGLQNVTGKRVREFAPDHEAHWFEIYGKVATSGESIRFIEEAKELDRWFDVYATKIGGAESKLVAVLFTDITARKLAEAERERLLKEVESERERLTDVFQRAPSFMCVLTGPDHVVERSNDRYNQLVGYRDLVGLKIREALPEVEGQGYFELLDEVYQTGEPYVGTDVTVLLQRQTDDASDERVVDFVYQALRSSEGEVTGILVQGIDLTDRKRAESALRESELRYRMIGEAANDAIWDWNLITNQVTWNEGLQKLTGFQANQVGTEASWWVEHIHPEDQERVVHSIHDAIDSGEKAWHEQYRFQRYDNSYAIVFDRGRIIHDENGKAIRMIGSMLDLTEKLAAETQLRETQSRLDSTLAAAEIGTWEYDPIQNLVKADANLARMFGVSAEEQVDGSLASYLDAIHPDDRERVTAAIERSLATQATYDTEYRLVDKEANVRWVVARGRVERDETGRAIRLPGVVMDISERKFAEKALQDSEAQLEMAMDSAGLGSWNIDPATNQLITDERFRKIFHGSTDPISYEEAFAAIHPEDRQRIRDAVEEATRPNSPAPYTEEYRVVHPSGAIRWALGKGRANFVGTGSEKQLVSFDGLVLDVTERKRTETALRESEEKLRLLVDTIPQLAWMAQPNGDIFWYNTRWYEYTGKTHSDMEGWGWQSVHDPQVLPKVIERWQKSINSGQAFDMTFPIKGADGQFRPFLTRINPLRNDQGEIQYWFGTNTDISEQTRIQEELREVAARLSDADRRKTEFLATLGHELRNPLAPIRTGLEVMKMSADDPVTIEEVRSMMERQVQQMVRLIDDLLDVSRITQGKMVLRTCRVDLAKIVQSAVEATRSFIDEGEHELKVTLPNQPVLLDADPNRLAQVLSNLLNNSAKYTPDGGQIRLSCKRDQSEVVMTVKDDGLGIPPDMLENIFEMFTQIDRPLEEGYTGLGIGLTLVKRLVEMHGGTIEVHSEGADKGSEFKVRLPILDESVITEAAPEIPVTTKKLRILVVDDNKAAATMLKMVVKMLGNEVRTAHDGQQAIEVASEFLPEVVLMDLGMPKMNGYEAASHIRNQSWGKDILLVALTGWGQDEDKERTQAAGFDHHLVKPAEPDAIQQLLATVNTKPTE